MEGCTGAWGGLAVASPRCFCCVLGERVGVRPGGGGGRGRGRGRVSSSRPGLRSEGWGAHRGRSSTASPRGSCRNRSVWQRLSHSTPPLGPRSVCRSWPRSPGKGWVPLPEWAGGCCDLRLPPSSGPARPALCGAVSAAGAAPTRAEKRGSRARSSAGVPNKPAVGQEG